MRQATVVGAPGALALSCLAALALSIYPLPMWLMPARPDWLALLVVYWVVRNPGGFGIGWAWLLGLLLDGVEGGVLGKHAFALSVVAYASLAIRPRLILYTLPQQMALVFVLVGIDQLLCHWVQNLTGRSTPSLMFLMASLTSALCWPLLAVTTGRLRSVDG